MTRFILYSACTIFLLSPTLSRAYLSPTDLAVAADRRSALVVNHTGSSIFRLSLPDGKIIKSSALKHPPSSLTLSKDGSTAYVAAGIAEGELYAIDTETLKVTESVELGHTPISPCLSPDGKTLYVCNRMNNSIAVIDAGTLKVTAHIPVPREPVAADITPDGKLLFVANHLPDGKANADYVACKVSVIDTGTRKVIKNIMLVNGAEGMRDIRVSPDGKYVFATHLVARFLVPTTQIERGWINTNAISVIRTSDRKLICTVLLDDVDRGFANPWAIDFSSDASLLCVSSAGTHEISLIDLKGLMAKIESAMPATEAKARMDPHNDLSFLSGLRTRVSLKGNGPRNIAVAGNTIYATEYFSDSLARVVINDATALEIASIPLAARTELTPERRGEMLFNDATICFQHWQSCASCHPDVRTDGLNWDLLNDGIGNPKNVKSLLLSHKTPPVMALGVREKAEVAVRAGIKYIHFAVRPEKDAEDIDAFLKSLEPDPSPHLLKGKLSKAAKRGKEVFEKAGCITCHPAPLFTDLQKHDVGSGTGQDAGKPFDTPTLREVWRTAPYMHDGRNASILELLKEHPQEKDRGGPLTMKEQSDLAEYVLSL